MSTEQYSNDERRDEGGANKFFNWGGDWAWTRYVVGGVLVIYGFWRAYRQVKGID